jgi:ubiquinone/menaquinone biosynthesis C-methylase UbiE
MDICSITFPDASFDGVTILEVLEHLRSPDVALREALRVARRFVKGLSIDQPFGQRVRNGPRQYY